MAEQAAELGLIDAAFGDSVADFEAQALAVRPGLPDLLQAKRQRRLADEAHQPLARYREEELAQMRRNSYGFDPSCHIARSNSVRRVPPSWTLRPLATHRGGGSVGVRAVDQDQGRVQRAPKESPQPPVKPR